MYASDQDSATRSSAPSDAPRGPKGHRERSRSPRTDSHRKDDSRRYRDRGGDRHRNTRDHDEPLNDASNRHKDSGRQTEEKRMAKALFTKDKSKSRRDDDDRVRERRGDRDGRKDNHDRNERHRDEDDRQGSSRSKHKDQERERDTDKSGDTDQSVMDKFGGGAKTSEKPKEKKEKPPPQPQSSEPMIIVTVNDRLGTKAQIPCFASDNVGLFKAQVAQRIGRKPHEIMLKRQGERPFKDILSLEDYGVSSGVQLDLELDTGD